MDGCGMQIENNAMGCGYFEWEFMQLLTFLTNLSNYSINLQT